MCRKVQTFAVLGLGFLLTVLSASSESLQTRLAWQQPNAVVDEYEITIRAKIPRIYDNMQSLGRRRYQPQRLKGFLRLVYVDGQSSPIVQIRGLENHTHRISGRRISYECVQNPEYAPLAVAVGSNRTGRFSVGAVEFSILADPSYNIGGLEEDNVLQLDMSGKGNISSGILKRIRGSVSGKMGCGCKVYGHVSPTRIYHAGVTDQVVDVAPLYGTWTAKWRFRRREHVAEDG